MTTSMFPTNDTWFLIHTGGNPSTGRLSSLLSADRSPDGRAALKVVDQRVGVPPGSIIEVVIDETWEQWCAMLSRAVKLNVATPADVAPQGRKP